MKINQYVVGPVQTNCYFVINDETKEMLVIDPGASAKALADKARKAVSHALGEFLSTESYKETQF